jgi:hypothetical protein
MEITVFGITQEEIEPKDENLIKVNLQDDDGSEGIWAYIDDITKIEYDKDNRSDKSYLASLANTSLSGVPWGCYIIFRMKGSSRPEALMSEIREKSKNPIPNKLQWEKATRNVIDGLKSGNKELADFNADSIKRYAFFLGENHELIKELQELKGN